MSHSDCQNVNFAIKGQGHAPAGGFANIDHGVTIDMTSLANISTNADNSIAYVGAGASWLDVYAALDPLNKTVAGGRNGGVGVGGLTLGGGISYFSPQVGFTCDTVMNFEVALADGALVNANISSHPDLFHALKGGTNNFGLVTRFDFTTMPYTGILGGSLANDISDRHAVFQAFANIAGSDDYDVHASIVTSLIFNTTSKAWALASTPIYTLPELDPPVYHELFAVPNISDTLSLTDLSTFSNESATPPGNWLFSTGTYGVSVDLLESIFDITNTTVYSFDPSDDVLWILALEPLPTVFLEHSAGNDSLGRGPGDGNGMILLVSALWPESADDAAVHAKAVQLMTAIDTAANDAGLLKPFVYTNYADWSQHPLESYGAESLARLKRTARKYDPHGVFQRRVPGGFKLHDLGGGRLV